MALLSVLALSACTTSRETTKEEDVSSAKQVEIVSEAAELDIEEEESIVMEDVTEDPVQAGAVTPGADTASIENASYGVVEEVEFAGDAGVNEISHAETYTAAEVQNAEIYVDEPPVIAVEEEDGLIGAQVEVPEIASGFYYFATDCAVRVSPDKNSTISNVVAKGRMLWVEEHGGEWARVFRRDGAAYIEKECLYHD